MMYRRTIFPTLLLVILSHAAVFAQELRTFTPDVALDVRTVRIAAVTDDGSRVAATVQTRRDRTDVDHMRYGDPTYVSPVSTRLMVIDTRTGEQSWVHEQPAQLRGYSWSPDGRQLGYFVSVGETPSLRVYDAETGMTRAVTVRSDMNISSSSPLVWSLDGGEVIVGLRPQGWATEARDAFLALTEAPVIVQDSRNDFLAWDRVRNIANRQVTALVSVADGSVRELLTETTPQGPAFSEDGTYITYSTATRTKTSYTRRDGTEYGLFKLDLASGEAEPLVEQGEERLNVDWNEARDAYAYTEEGSVFVRRLDDEEAEKVTEDHEAAEGDTTEVRYSVQSWSPDGEDLLLSTEDGWQVLDVSSGEMQVVLTLEEDEDARPRRAVQGWSEDGRYLFFTYSERGRWQRGLKRLDIGSGEIDTLILDEQLYRSWSISADGNTVVYAMSDGDRPDDLWVTGHDYAAPNRLTEMNPQLADVALTRSELVEYLDVDGNTLYGILYYPANYEARADLPARCRDLRAVLRQRLQREHEPDHRAGLVRFPPVGAVRGRVSGRGVAEGSAQRDQRSHRPRSRRRGPARRIRPELWWLCDQSAHHADGSIRSRRQRLGESEHHLVSRRLAEDHHPQLCCCRGRPGSHRSDALGAAPEVHPDLGGHVRGPHRDTSTHAVG